MAFWSQRQLIGIEYDEAVTCMCATVHPKSIQLDHAQRKGYN